MISNPGKSPASPEIAHPIEHLARHELEREARAGILRNRERLQAIGVIDTVDEGAIDQLVASFFQAVEAKRKVLQPGEKIEHTPEARELVRLLAFAGIIAPIALADWTIDRLKEAENRLGLKSFTDLEQVMATKYKRPRSPKAVHFHKGPGNCVLMEYLRGAPTAKDWEQVGMGDKLYYSIAKLLYQFVHPEKQDKLKVQRFIELISIALQRALAKHWYEVKGNVIQDWNPKVPFFDVNLIFELLKNPIELLDELKGERKTTKAHYLASGEFEADTIASLAEGVRQLLLRFEADPFGARAESLLDTHEENLGRRLFGLRTISKRANSRLRQAEDECVAIDLLKEMIERLSKDEPIIKQNKTRVYETIEQIEAMEELKESEIIKKLCKDLKRDLKHKPYNERKPNLLLGTLGHAHAEAEASAIIAQFAKELEGLTQESHSEIEDTRSLFDAFRAAQKKVLELEAELKTLKARKPGKTAELLQRREEQVKKQLGILEAYDGKSDLPKAIIGIAKAHGITIAGAAEWGEKKASVVAALQAQFAEIQKEKGRTVVSGGLDAATRQRLLANIFGPGKFSSQEFLKEIFTEEFTTAFGHSEFYRNPNYAPGATYPGTDQSVLDLNRYPEVYFKNYIPGWFTEMPQKFAGQQFLIISAERSDSHEKNEDFEKDIRGNLNLLAPGGILLIDGLKQSYSRIHRLEEIQRALKGRESEFKAEVVMNEAGKTIALLVQRNHPKGYLTPEEKAQCFQKGVSFQSLRAVRTHPRIAILSPLRRRILVGAEEDPEVFKIEQLHDRMNARLSEFLLQMAEQKLKNHYCEETRAGLAAVMQIDEAELDQAILDYVDRSHYEGKGLITPQDIIAIRDRLAADLVEPLERSGRAKKLFAPHSLEFLTPGRIYAFPRLGIEESPINEELTYDEDEDFDNTYFLRLSELLKDRIRSVNRRLTGLRRRLGGKPILIIDFADCTTNDLLRERLESLLGSESYKSNVDVLKIDFRPGQMIKDLPYVQRRIESFAARGGIVIGGGSWFDSYDDYGKTYKKEVTHPLLDTIQQRDSRLRLIQICFSYQTISDAIGKRFCRDIDHPGGETDEEPIRTVPGMLEIGYVPIEIEREEKQHPLFFSCPPRLTVAFTHSGHVDDRRKEDLKERTRHFLRPLARSRLTGLPIMSAGFGDRVFAMQFHPELYGEEDVERIMSELDDRYKKGIADTFGVSTDHIRHNFKRTPRVNAGDHILVNALHHHTHDIKA